MKYSIFIIFVLLIHSTSNAELGYKPYFMNYENPEFSYEFLESEESMNEQLETQRAHMAERIGLNSYFESEQNYQSENLIESLNAILKSYDSGKVLFVTTLKDPSLAIEQRIVDKNTVALEDKPVRQFLQSAYCLALSPFRYFIDPLCRRERADAQETIDRLRNNEIWFEYVAQLKVIKVVLDDNDQKTLALYEFNNWKIVNGSAPSFKFNTYSVEDLAERLQVAYYFHGFRRRTHIPTEIFKVYETN